jgi:cob(I)alamin adenosyltransferase
MIQIFWGNGKGKTTAAIGAAVRATGHDLKVHMIQFLKSGPYKQTGELSAINHLPDFTYERFGAGRWLRGEPTEEHRDAAGQGLDAAEAALCSGKYDLVILDEVLYLLSAKLIKTQDLAAILKKCPDNVEVILTGSHEEPPKKLLKMADLVTHMKKQKHPYDRKIKARKGFDY